MLKLQEQQTDQEEPASTAKKLSFQEDKQRQREERKRKRRIEELETLIEEKEAEIAAIELEMTNPDVFDDHKKTMELTDKLSALKEELDVFMNEWAVLEEN